MKKTFRAQGSGLGGKALLAIGGCLLMLALYSFAGTSDRLEPISQEQQAVVVGWWGGR